MDDDRDARPASRRSRPAARARRRGRPRRRPAASGRARSSASSGPTAPARPRPCGCSRRCSRPTSGEATVAGADLRREPQAVRERIGYVPQGGSTDPAETGRGELVIQGRLYGMDEADAERRARPRSSRPSTSRPPPTARPATYSGGMRAGSTSASASSTGPPSCSSTSRRPASTRRPGPACGTRSAALRGHGTTVFLTTHYLEEADALRRPAGDHRPRADRRRGHGRRAQAPGRRRRHHHRRRRRRRSTSSRRSARQPFVREATRRGRPRPPVRRPAARPPCPQLLRVLDGAGLRARLLTLARPEPRRRLPAPDRPLAARGGRRPDPATQLHRPLDHRQGDPS